MSLCETHTFHCHDWKFEHDNSTSASVSLKQDCMLQTGIFKNQNNRVVLLLYETIFYQLYSFTDQFLPRLSSVIWSLIIIKAFHISTRG